MDSVYLVFFEGDYTPAVFSTYSKARLYKEIQEHKNRRLVYFGCNPIDTDLVIQ
jgi:hypothetical protein